MVSDRQLFTARFSDGQSARAIDVHGELRTDAIVFWPADAEHDGSRLPDEHWVWRYDTLTTNETVSAGDPDVLVHYPDMPDASLFVKDHAFIRRLTQEARHTSSSAWLWRFTRPAIAILAALIAIGGAVYVFDLSPAKALARLMPQEMREQIASSLFTSLTKGRYKVCSTPSGNEALAAMVARLRQPGDPPFTTEVVDWSLENAFALPGGRIVLTRGLIEGADNAEEVTGVLAHEIGHVVKLHPETGVVRAMGLTVAAQFIFSGGSETLGGIGTLLVALQFNRGAEREADDVGLAILKKTGVDPKPLAGFFNRMLEKQTAILTNPNKKKDESESDFERRRKLQRTLSNSLEMFSTHPPSDERVATISAAAGYKTRPVLNDAQWKALRAICKSAK